MITYVWMPLFCCIILLELHIMQILVIKMPFSPLLVLSSAMKQTFSLPPQSTGKIRNKTNHVGNKSLCDRQGTFFTGGESLSRGAQKVRLSGVPRMLS